MCFCNISQERRNLPFKPGLFRTQMGRIYVLKHESGNKIVFLFDNSGPKIIIEEILQAGSLRIVFLPNQRFSGGIGRVSYGQSECQRRMKKNPGTG